MEKKNLTRGFLTEQTEFLCWFLDFPMYVLNILANEPQQVKTGPNKFNDTQR